MMKIAAFDLDGTIADTMSMCIEVFCESVSAIRQRGRNSRMLIFWKRKIRSGFFTVLEIYMNISGIDADSRIHKSSCGLNMSIEINSGKVSCIDLNDCSACMKIVKIMAPLVKSFIRNMRPDFVCLSSFFCLCPLNKLFI